MSTSALRPELLLVLAAAPLGLWLAARWPGRLLTGLILLVLAQDALVGLGLGWLQRADEGLVVAGAAGLGLRALARVTPGGRPGPALLRTPLDRPSLALAASGLAAALLQPVPPVVAALGTLAIFKGLLAWHLAARVPLDRARLRGFLGLLLTLASGLGLVALLQRLGGEPVYALTGQLTHFRQWAGGKTPSLFFNHNALGHVMVFGGALGLGLALASRIGRAGGAPDIPDSAPARRAPGSFAAHRPALAALVCLAGLLVSASREGWIGAAAGLLLAAALTRSRRLWRIGGVTTLLLVAGGLAVYSSSEAMREELARRSAGVVAGWHDYRLGFTGWQYRGEYRVYALLESLAVWREQPWLGTGPGRFGGQVALSHPSPVYERHHFLPLDGQLSPLDIFWARLLAEWGLVGSAAFLWAFGCVLLVSWRAARKPDVLTRAVGLGGIVAWGAMLVFGLFAPAFEDPLTAIPFWAWGGLAWRLGSEDDDRAAGAGTIARRGREVDDALA